MSAYATSKKASSPMRSRASIARSSNVESVSGQCATMYSVWSSLVKVPVRQRSRLNVDAAIFTGSRWVTTRRASG